MAIRESTLVRDVLKYLGARPDCRVWRNNTGSVAGMIARLAKALADRGFSGASIALDRIARRLGFYGVLFGLEGSADVLGLRLPHGQLIAIECKSATGKTTPQQDAFGRMVRAMGGLYLVVRDVADLYSEFPK